MKPALNRRVGVVAAVSLAAGLAVLPLAVAGAMTGLWSPTSSMHTARYYHTMTLLPSGQVLVTGGCCGLQATAEVYNPTTGLWNPTGTMATAREWHSATLLHSGKVLVAGGAGFGPALASAELYDPATGTWSATGSMHSARYNHRATLLSDGRVLVAGGQDASGITFASSELYDPTTGTWTVSGSMTTPREYHTMTLLRTGKVLVTGGLNFNPGGHNLATAEVYDPVTGTWSPAGTMNSARYAQTATLLANGQVLVAGGMQLNTAYPLATAELYNPATGGWRLTGPLHAPRAWHTATRLPSGSVLVAGGADNCVQACTPVASAELYNARTGAWSVAASMHAARWYHTAAPLLNGQVLVAGGAGPGSSAIASAEVFRP